jgi:20S proteasome alpha/beta subunit
MLEPSVNETIIVRSLRVTNKSGSNTPTVTIKNNNFEIVNTQQLATSTSVEILTLPLIVEGGTKLAYTTAGTVSDGVVFGISYLNILKEKTD